MAKKISVFYKRYSALTPNNSNLGQYYPQSNYKYHNTDYIIRYYISVGSNLLIYTQISQIITASIFLLITH